MTSSAGTSAAERGEHVAGDAFRAEDQPSHRPRQISLREALGLDQAGGETTTDTLVRKLARAISA